MSEDQDITGQAASGQEATPLTTPDTFTSEASGSQPGQGQGQEPFPVPGGPVKEVPAVLTDPPAVAEGPRDHAAGQMQQGIPQDPNPPTQSGIPVAKVAEVAFQAVQEYKLRVLNQVPKSWDHLSEPEQRDLAASVVKMLRGESAGAATIVLDEAKAKGREAYPLAQLAITDPGEARKAVLFAQVAVALVRSV